MNIAFFTRPKQEITYLYNDITVDQALEKMHSTSYAAVPVIDREGHYVGTVSEGDLLWFIVKGEGGEPHTMAIESLKQFKLSDVNLNKYKYRPVLITDETDATLPESKPGETSEEVCVYGPPSEESLDGPEVDVYGPPEDFEN